MPFFNILSYGIANDMIGGRLAKVMHFDVLTARAIPPTGYI